MRLIYYIYSLLVLLGFSQYKERLARVKMLLGLLYFYTHISSKLETSGSVQRLDKNFNPVYHPYLQYLLEQTAAGKYRSVKDNTLLVGVFRSGWSGFTKKMAAYAIIHSPDPKVKQEAIRLAGELFWFVTLEEQDAIIKFWLKDIPVYSRLVPQRKELTRRLLSDEVTSDLFQVLENGATPSELVEHYFINCNDKMEYINTAKELLVYHIMTLLNRHNVKRGDKAFNLRFFVALAKLRNNHETGLPLTCYTENDK